MSRFSALFVLLVGLFSAVKSSPTARSFAVDYENNQFLKDGQPFRYVSGSLHYFRVPKPYWKDRMEKMRLAGLNAVQTYVEWSGHEPEPGKYNFEGDYDLKSFLDTAKEVGLSVVFRPGPYICAERDNGGLPYWLLRVNPNMKYRTSDASYIAAVDRWFNVLLPMVEPYLYKNGGPIITVQVENEYGQYFACDRGYMEHLANITRHHLGQDVVLFRTDAPADAFYKCDYVDGTLVTADFGSAATVSKEFATVRRAMQKGPLIVTEYYPGWLDHWGSRHAKVDQGNVLKTFEEILQFNASVNFYMFHGGTNFAFMNGANPPPQPTSYDYGAPLTEAGDPTDTYFKIRDVVGRYLPLPNGTLPVPAPKLKLGPVKLTCASLDAILAFLRERGYVVPVTSQHPKSFEELGQAFGYVLYTTTVQFRPRSPANLAVPGIKNRGYVFTAQTRTVLSTDQDVYEVPVIVRKGENVTILVENTGRLNYGAGNHDMKGILGDVTLDGHVLTDWTMEALPLSNPEAVRQLTDVIAASTTEPAGHCSAPGAFFGSFVLPEGQPVLDTFLDPSGWGKGVAFVNNFNLGRYWPSIGPQGILGDVSLDNHVLEYWTMEVLPLSNSSAVRALTKAFAQSSILSKGSKQHCSTPGAFFGEFVLPKGQPVQDTFLDPRGWGKGVAFVNDFNLGRYWPSMGPQVTLYVPGVLLFPYPKKNTIFLFETESAPTGDRAVFFVDEHNIDGPVPKYKAAT